MIDNSAVKSLRSVFGVSLVLMFLLGIIAIGSAMQLKSISKEMGDGFSSYYDNIAKVKLAMDSLHNEVEHWAAGGSPDLIKANLRVNEIVEGTKKLGSEKLNASLVDWGNDMAQSLIKKNGQPDEVAAKKLLFSLGIALDEALKERMLESKRVADEIGDGVSHILPIYFLLVTIGCTFLGVSIFLTYQKIQDPLDSVSDFLKKTASRDFTADIPKSAEDNFKDLSQNAKELRKTIMGSVKDIKKASGDIGEKGEIISLTAEIISQNAVKQSSVSKSATNRSDKVLEEVTPILRVIDTIISSTDKVLISAREIESALQDATERIESLGGHTCMANDSVSKLDEANSAISSICSSISELSKNLSQAASVFSGSSEQLRSEVLAGKAMTSDMVDQVQTGMAANAAAISSMGRIRESVERSITSFKSLDAELTKIGRVTQVIEDIAGRTNLLSLNAAIIASQAGEKGHAFGVVAGEIRALAEKTSLSTKEIKTIVKNISREGRVASEVIESGIEKVAEGEQKVRETNEVFEKIYTSADKADRGLKIIDKATKEQVENLSRITSESKEVSLGINQIMEKISDQSKIAGQVSKGFIIAGMGFKDINSQLESNRQEAEMLISVVGDYLSSCTLLRDSAERLEDTLREMRASLEAVDFETTDGARVALVLNNEARLISELSQRIIRELNSYDQKVV